MEQYNFTYNNIHKTVRSAAARIKESGFEPDYLLAIGGGGLIPASIMRTYINKPILTVSLTRYSDEMGTAPASTPIKLQWLESDTNLDGKKVLVIDEVDDERTTLEFTLNHLYEKHQDTEFAAFVVHNKLKEKKGVLPAQLSHFFSGEDIHDYWINYAWDAEDIEQFGK
jgi:hypoxanthine phosphoribosyltransferase